MHSTLDSDVLIIGCGPVGKLLALRLAEAGHRITVAERFVDSFALPRAVTHDSEAARIFQAVGLAPDTMPDVTEPYDGMYVWQNAREDVLLEVDWSGIGESGWYNTYFFHQPALEGKFQELLESLPNVTVLRGWEYQGHRDDGGSVTVTLTDTTDGAPCELTTGYLIGADGANSRVRTDIGSAWHDHGYFFDWLVVDVAPAAERQFPHIARQTCDIARPCTMVPGGPGRRRWEFMRLPHEKIEDIDRAEFAWSLLSRYGVDPTNAELERHSTYTFQAGWALDWRKGRVLIAGDAAHLMPPFAGQGLCAGLRDAMNLAWKLSAVLDGTAHPDILDSYGSERIAHVSEFIDFSMGLGKVICLTDPDEAARRDQRMITERAEGSAPPAPPRPRLGTGLHRGPHGGTLSIQARVGAEATAPLLLDDVLGGAGALIARNDETLAQLSDENSDALARLGLTVCVVDDADGVRNHLQVRDAEGRYRRWLDHLAVDAVLVRPDFYLYGTATGPAEVAELVAALRGALDPALVTS
ncbi:monooxygenase [Rhodococcus opacus PD630]|uniref:bifunctional 3-(3-hydroxy-phenyl)propionate/3-hydroxycinnamic acid hydroxylase MhpA n=1 Tax=Rhodococcus opacus TaxID=37919 RepID=UPI00029CC7D7|nr:bifunctional 3-(3-hydroxy-phenyl)propionate/3-hydroxycinnamic acid hydroxylase [Rhodococcus opacus]AHK27393.1 3-(3-hydroxy-phenyl)propionate/3-hydroxycinnamic acid hydroxylase [Rhodococcus opacus PD630]EHI47597.1 monooxygenase [Rhodococcus opacus PD630]UDG97392.1 bifunctional 3-(3-hydroxy-phenyl)propionate/3-hydroxycinnamic acid hydroxylase [Rhodococcus opacus PD630]